MPSLDYVHVDVFSDAPFGGNSVPVFYDAPDLSAPELLRITQELRHFEAVFLRPTGATRSRSLQAQPVARPAVGRSRDRVVPSRVWAGEVADVAQRRPARVDMLR